MKLKSNFKLIMPIYECKMCNFISKSKYNYERHKKTNKHKKMENEREMKRSNEKQREATRSNEKQREATGVNLFKSGGAFIECIYCKKGMVKKHLNKHYRDFCLEIPDKLKNKIIEKYNNDKRVKNKQIVIHNGENNQTTINNNTLINNNYINNMTNNNININLNAFGNENIEKITEKQILEILNKAYSSFPLLLKQLHFDVEENRNMYQPNINKPFIKYYNGERWQSDKFDSISQQIFNKVSRTLEDWLEEHQTKLHDRKQNLLNNFINDCNGGRTEKKFIEELKIFFMDYSNHIKDHIVDKIKATNLLDE